MTRRGKSDFCWKEDGTVGVAGFVEPRTGDVWWRFPIVRHCNVPYPWGGMGDELIGVPDCGSLPCSILVLHLRREDPEDEQI